MRHDWTYKRFDEVFDLQMGKTPDRKKLQFFEGDNVWVSIRDMVSKEIDDSNEHISDSAVTSTNIRKVKKGTVIMSFKLTVGKCAIAARDLYTNEAIMAFNLKEGFDIKPDFLYYYLLGYRWEGANKAVMGMTLNKATISQHKIGYPHSSIQLSIVAELNKINDLIGQKKSQLKDLDSLARSIFYDMFGDPVDNEKGWEVKNMVDLCTNIVDCPHSTPKKSDFVTDYPCIRTSELKGGSITWDTMQYLEKEEYEKRIARLKPEAGDIVFGREGSIGDAVILPKGYNFSLGQRTMLLRANTKILSNVFLHRVILSEWIKQQIEYVNVSSTVAHVNIKDFKQFTVPLPPLPLQQSFAAKIAALEQKKQMIKASIKDLETLLASRMQFWFE